MNIEEGVRRMKRAGQCLIVIPATVILLLLTVGEVASFVVARGGRPMDLMLFSIPLLPPCFFLWIAGWLLWIAGWIVEGFGENPD